MPITALAESDASQRCGNGPKEPGPESRPRFSGTKIQPRLREGADGHIKSPLPGPRLQHFLNLQAGNAVNHVGILQREVEEVVHVSPQPGQIQLLGVKADCPRKFPSQFCFVLCIRDSGIASENRNLVARGQLAQNMVGTDVAAVAHGQEPVCLHPQDFHRTILTARLLPAEYRHRLCCFVGGKTSPRLTGTHSVHYYANPLIWCNSAAEWGPAAANGIEVKPCVFMLFDQIRRNEGGSREDSVHGTQEIAYRSCIFQ